MKKNKLNLKVKYININELIPYTKNAKLHPAEQIEQIKKSITEFGMNDPIAIDKNNIIVEGHGRLIACKELGYTEVPIIRLDHLSDEERKAYTLAHNKLTMNSDFDIDILNDELDDILNIDMSDFGFENIDIDWDNVKDLTTTNYDKPEHNMLECPQCHHIDRDIHFKKVKNADIDEEELSDEE